MEKKQAASRGIGFQGLLTLLFIALKLLDKIDWSWLWVLSPLWIPIAAVMVLVIAIGMAIGIALGVAALLDRRDRLRRLRSLRRGT